MFVGTSPERPLFIFAAIAETDTVMARAAVRRRAIGINPVDIERFKAALAILRFKRPCLKKFQILSRVNLPLMIA
jgi:hypothetical protein